MITAQINLPTERLEQERKDSFGNMALYGLLVSPALNLAWIPLDYIVAPAFFSIFLYCRVAYMTVGIMAFFLLKLGKISMELATHISFSCIIFQIAYMCNVAPVASLHLYHMGAAAFFLGVGSMIVWRPVNGYIFLSYAIVISLGTYFIFGIHSIDTQLSNDMLLNITTWLFPVFAGGLRYNNFLSQVQQRYQLEVAGKILSTQKGNLENAYRRITDSITYAQRIQQNLLPNYTQWKQTFPHSVLINLPKDILSGDFYWYHFRNGHHYIAIGDCTGHGVPGALTTVQGINILNQIIHEPVMHSPKSILTRLSKLLMAQTSIHTENTMKEVEGIDMAILQVKADFSELVYCGAKRPLYHFSANGLAITKGNNYSIGNHYYEEAHIELIEHQVPILAGDSFYLFTDGYADQMGGANNKKFMTGKLRNVLESNISLEMSQQEEELLSQFLTWKGNEPQIDDVLLLGFQFTPVEQLSTVQVISAMSN